MIYFDANSEFKFGTKENEYIGINDNRVTVTDKAGAGVSGSDNFVVENAGWYLFYVKAAVKGDDYQLPLLSTQLKCICSVTQPAVHGHSTTNGSYGSRHQRR